MPNIGATELILIVVVILLLFGAKRLPEIGRSIGKGIREFKKGVTEGEKGDNECCQKDDDKSNSEQS